MPAAAIARLRDPAGAVAGAAFLVTRDLVLTCAHIVERRGDGPLTVEFALRAGGTATVAAEVAGVTPIAPDGGGDIAVLRLLGPRPDGVRPAWLTVADTVWGQQVRLFGFPAALEDYGMWTAAELRDRQAAGWLQIESAAEGRGVGPGFSGAPAWSPDLGGVVGMVVAVDDRTGYLIPARTLVAEYPALAAPDAGSPYRGLEPFQEEHAAVFRGRDGLAGELARLVESRPLLALAGPSGSGKSSLLHAGLVPRLRAAGWPIAAVRTLPGVPPARLLAAALAPLLDRAQEPPADEPADEPGLGVARELARRLVDEPEETLDLLAVRLGRVVIVVDQLEEAVPEDATGMIALLHALTARGPARAVVTMRAGLLDRVVTGATAEALDDGLKLVPPMTRAELLAAVEAPGVAFETGLVDRLLGDAEDEPGRLPLLEFTLDQLWQRRVAGQLTHAAYAELGGVSGALARYAQEVYAGLGAGDQDRARRLLAQLARPADDGGFQRRPARLADLDDDLRAVLARLVAARLVVIDERGAGGPFAELAHQALLQRWPELGGWLTADREFRDWQERLRLSRERWEADRRDPGGLLRGVALATAEARLAERPGDIGASDAAYVRAGRDQQRRRLRVLRVVVAGVSALALIASTLAVVAVWQTIRVRAELHTAASRQLADDSARFRGNDPEKSLQLALAAWHADDSPEAYGALFTQYAAMQPVDRLFAGLTADGGQVAAVSTSRDGSAAVVTSNSGLPAVWVGLDGDDPQQVTFAQGRPHVGGEFRISPSGRWVAYANGLGGVAVWDVTRPELPMVDLAPDGPDTQDEQQYVQAIQFSADDRRVVVLRSGYGDEPPELRVWDVPTGRRVAVAKDLAADFRPTSAFFAPGNDQLVLADYTRAAVYDLGTGRRVRALPELTRGQGLLAVDGAVQTSCQDDTLRLRDVASGKLRSTLKVPSCSGSSVDANGEFAIFAGYADNDEPNAFVIAVDLRSNRTYRFAVPRVEILSGFDATATFAIFRGAGGLPVALLGDRRSVYRIPLGDPVTLPPAADQFEPGRVRSLTPDGAYRLTIQRSGRVSLAETATNRELASVTGTPPALSASFQGVWFRFTEDSRRLLTVVDDELVVYSVPSLTVEHRLPLPVPDNLGPPPNVDGISDSWAGSVVPVGADQAVVLYASVLTRWDLVAGRRLDEPVPLRPDQPGGQRRAAEVAFVSSRRAGHDDQVAVVLPGGGVQVWSTAQARIVAEFKEADAVMTQPSVLFDTKGQQLAVLDTDGVTTLREVAKPGALPSSVPTGQVTGLLGFTPNALLLTVDVAGDEIWQGDNGKKLAFLNTPSDGAVMSLGGANLTMSSDGLNRTIKLDPDGWFRTLCGLAGRPYTPQEEALLVKDGAPKDKPCP